MSNQTMDIQWQGPEFYHETVHSAIPRAGDFVTFGEQSFTVKYVVWMYDLNDSEPRVRVVMR